MKIRETWQNGSVERSIVYQSRAGKTGRHCVKVYYQAGEQDFPSVYWCETVEQAREVWKKIRSAMAKDGLQKS